MIVTGLELIAHIEKRPPLVRVVRDLENQDYGCNFRRNFRNKLSRTELKFFTEEKKTLVETTVALKDTLIFDQKSLLSSVKRF